MQTWHIITISTYVCRFNFKCNIRESRNVLLSERRCRKHVWQGFNFAAEPVYFTMKICDRWLSHVTHTHKSILASLYLLALRWQNILYIRENEEIRKIKLMKNGNLLKSFWYIYFPIFYFISRISTIDFCIILKKVLTNLRICNNFIY